MESELINPNPTVYAVKEDLHRRSYAAEEYGDDDEGMAEEIDSLEIFDLIRRINDPEHPLTLEQLNVTQHDLIQVDNGKSQVNISFTPTIPHCSMATLIGLCIRVKLLRSLPSRFKVPPSLSPSSSKSSF
jgi:metal-sulfur cluster biosynthetic enzyme